MNRSESFIYMYHIRLDPIRFHQFDVIIRHSSYVTVVLE